MDSGGRRKQQQSSLISKMYDEANIEKTLETTRKQGNTGKNDGVYQKTGW